MPDPSHESHDQKKHETETNAPPRLPANITRQQLTNVEVKHGIKLRMRYEITKPGSYEVVIIGDTCPHIQVSEESSYFPLKDLHFPLNNLHCPLKNLHFLLKNLHFPFKTLQLYI